MGRLKYVGVVKIGLVHIVNDLGGGVSKGYEVERKDLFTKYEGERRQSC